MIIARIGWPKNVKLRLGTNCTTKLLPLLLVLALPAVVQTRCDTLDSSAPVLGTSKGHEELWRQHEADQVIDRDREAMERDREAEAQRQFRRERDLEENVKARNEGVQAARAKMALQPKSELSKGEFAYILPVKHLPGAPKVLLAVPRVAPGASVAGREAHPKGNRTL